MFKRFSLFAVFIVLCISRLILFENEANTFSSSSASVAQSSTVSSSKTPKYLFLFIGDGMSHVQIHAAQVYRGNNAPGKIQPHKLNFTQFPAVGIATTHDATSFCPDSAATATSIACGVKTHSGVLGLGVDKTSVVTSITEILKKQGMKIGIVSSVTLNHATPAAFYTHVPSRSQYYDIAMQMAESGFDYFAGGTLNNPARVGKANAFDVLKTKGYTIADTVESIRTLNSSSGKVYAVSPKLQDSGAMPYTLDAHADDITLAEFVEKGIELLDNEKGFFMMCESGKIDWACHANDALSVILDVIGFEAAIQKAIGFAEKHPDETLILVTGDHETGGMSIGYSVTGYNTAFDILSRQKMSYIAFNSLIGEMKSKNPDLTIGDVLPIIKTNFGLLSSEGQDAADPKNKAFVLNDYEYSKLERGFSDSIERKRHSTESAILYGSYDPLSVTLTHIINNKAGIGWTSYSHTGTPVPVYAKGAKSELFNGSYDNTDIFKKMREAFGL